MPEIWMDVDAALSEVPVNLLPLIDDTDFKTVKTAIAYNSAGLALLWNFVTTAGAQSQTAVTPTTGGNYDWAHQGNGLYSIEIPASGGASINNDTEGFGWFSGVATGVLPWRGPVIGFRAAALNNALIDGGDLLDVNVKEISDDSVAADNLEAGYDGTGYANTNSTMPTVTNVTNKVAATVATGDATDLTTLLARIIGTIAAGTHNPQSGDSFARIGANGAGLTSVAIVDNGVSAGAMSSAAIAKIEAALLNEGDGQALIDAIVAAIDAANIDTDILPALIRDAILNRVLAGNHDTAGTLGKLAQNMNATVSSRSTFAPATDVVARVTLVDTCTVNTDMRGTNGANTVVPDAAGTAASLISALQSHGDSTWATATGFATPAQLAALQSHGDTTWATAVGFATTANVASIIAAIGSPQQSGVAVTLPTTPPAGYGGAGGGIEISSENVTICDT